MARDIDEVLSVKLSCAGVIICNAILIIDLMNYFIQSPEMYDDITNFRHYFSYSTLCVVTIACVYFIERGNRLCWLITVVLHAFALLCLIADFKIAINFYLGFVLLAISFILLLMPPICKKCRIPVLERVPWKGES